MDMLGDKGLKQSLSKISADLPDRMADKVDKRGRGVGPETSAEKLHPLRKSLKKLRYSLEFLSSLYPRKATKRYLRPLKNLQKSLGIINDAAVALRLADELAQERVELTIAVAAIARKTRAATRDRDSRKNGPRTASKSASGVNRARFAGGDGCHANYQDELSAGQHLRVGYRGAACDAGAFLSPCRKAAASIVFRVSHSSCVVALGSHFDSKGQELS